MRDIRLGVSLYPEFASPEVCREYLRVAAKYGYRVLFVALLGVKDEREEVVRRYRTLTDEAHELGFEVFCDVNPSILARYGVNASVMRGKIDLGFLQEIGCDVMRLDSGLSEMEEAFLSRNDAGIGVCLNASANGFDHLGALLASGGEPSRIVGCHNYYPHRRTGLTLDYFLECSRLWNERGMRLQAFVSSQEPDAFGSWPVCDGLPTLEMHRDISAAVQARHLVQLGCVDDIIVGNCFASEEELAAIAAGVAAPMAFTVHTVPGLPSGLEQRLRLKLSCRPEQNGYLIRTIESRMVKEAVPPFNAVDIKRGDVLVDNDGYGQYAGEVQVALASFENDGRTNVVGHLDEDELVLLDGLRAGTRFTFNIV